MLWTSRKAQKEDTSCEIKPAQPVINIFSFELSVKNRRLDLNVQKNELKKRREEMKYKPELKRKNTERGYAWLYQNHVLQADEGCDFDFLKARE